MRTIPGELQTCLEERPHDVVELLELTDLSGNAVRLTSNGEDIATASGDEFLGYPGFNRSAITYEIGGAAAVTDITVPIAVGQPITPLQIERGVWRRSTAHLWLADRLHPDNTVLLFRGYVGKTATSDGIVGQLSLNSLAEKNSDIVLPKVAAACNYVFGGGFGTSKGCRVNVGAFVVSGDVSVVIKARQSFVITAEIDGSLDFSNGALRFLSGDNLGIPAQIRFWDLNTGRVDLLRPLPYTINPGDTIQMHPGCKRTLTDCTRFGGLTFWPGYGYGPGENKAAVSTS